MNYKAAFVVTLSVLVALVVSAVVAFDRTIEGYIYPYLLNDTTTKYVFLDPSWYEDVDLLPMSYDRNVRTVADFEAWRGAFTGEGGVLSADVQRPAAVETTETSRRNGYTLNKLLVDGALIVYEAVPDQPSGKAVVVTPGTGHTGARDVMGIPSEYSFSYYQGEIGDTLARAGYVVYVPELTGWGERQVDVGSACASPVADVTRCSYDVLSLSLGMYGISTEAIHLNESAKTFSYALSKNDRVAVAGLSAGCSGALGTALGNANDVSAVVLASCIGRTHGVPMGWGGPGGGTPSGQNLHSEPVDAVSALAPVPVYMSYGSRELGMSYEIENGDVRRMVARAYDLVGEPERFEYVVHGGGHEYDVDSVIAFLDRSY